jgi:hypothetical protein
MGFLETILRKDISYHGQGGEVNEDVFLDAMVVWESFFLFNDAVTRGCDDENSWGVE